MNLVFIIMSHLIILYIAVHLTRNYLFWKKFYAIKLEFEDLLDKCLILDNTSEKILIKALIDELLKLKTRKEIIYKIKMIKEKDLNYTFYMDRIEAMNNEYAVKIFNKFMDLV